MYLFDYKVNILILIKLYKNVEINVFKDLSSNSNTHIEYTERKIMLIVEDNMEVSLARIEMPFDQLDKRKKMFNKTIEIPPSSITTSSLDEEFVKKAVSYVEDNMDNSDYSVNHLSEDINMKPYAVI